MHAAGIALAMKEYFTREGISAGKYSTLLFRRQIHMSFNTATKKPEIDAPLMLRVKLPADLYQCDGFYTSDDEGHYTFDEIMAEHRLESENEDVAPPSPSTDGHTPDGHTLTSDECICTKQAPSF